MMELSTAAVLVAIASPVIMTAVTWGSFKARLYMLEQRVEGLEKRERERHALHAH